MNLPLPPFSQSTRKYAQTNLLVSSLIRLHLLLIFGFVTTVPVIAQTDFAPGQIMFTAYNSDDADGFSIVLLADVVATTTIYITDRGWGTTGGAGFRDDNNGEGTISFQFNSDYPCGTTIVFEDVNGANDWTARDIYGITIGTITIHTSTTESPSQDIDGMELTTDGDQLFIYQLPEPNPGDQSSFVTGIHMNGGAWNGNNGDDFSSQKPSGLADNQVVRFNTEVDNAKYDCTPSTGTASALQAAIENDNGGGTLIPDASNNWNESNNRFNLYPACNFCCGSTAPAVAPVLSAPATVMTNSNFTITITGTLIGGAVWELYTSGCGVGSPVQTTSGNNFIVTSPATEGLATYYVRTSETVDCEALCATITIGVCTNTNNMNTCTSCSADPQVCGDCFIPPTADNPDLDSGCYAIRLIFILDESGSIVNPINYSQEVEDGVLAFLNSLNGQDIEIALIEFACEARVVTNYTPINDPFILAMEGYFNGVPFGGQTYDPFNPGGSCAGTNWHDAMIKADAISPIADMIMFFTDGIPTGWNTVWNACGDGSSTQTPEIVNPVKLANKFKSEDTHMFMLGVGSGIDAYNLQLMSGPIEYNSNNNTIGSSDYSIGNFVDLAEDLEAFVNELCETPLVLYKEKIGAVCDGVQQFRFIIHNPGEESAATVIQVIDTFPNGYENIQYFGSPLVKLCIGAGCIPQGQGQPPNAFIWTTNSLPPGESDTLILFVDVLPTGNHTNIAWAAGDNTDIVSDTVIGDLITDDLPPTISCPINITVECSDILLPSNTGTATGADPDGSTPTITYSDVEDEGACTGESIITRTWLATDGCTNTATCIQLIYLEDTTPPDIDCPANVSVQCGAITLPSSTGNGSADDNCDPVPIITYTDIPFDLDCGSGINRTWLATDDCGNTSTCLQVISITDTVIPVITCPANVTILCTASQAPSNTGGSATATDNCGGTPSISYTDEIDDGLCNEEYTIVRTWQATDECGNTGTCNQLITVQDNTAPVLSCPPHLTIECTSSILPTSTGTATATDNCDNTLAITYSDNITSGACPQAYTIIRTWTATDGCTNSSTCTQSITVDDTVSPVITCPAPVTIQCTDDPVPSITGSPSATDNCDMTIVFTYSDVTISGPCAQEPIIQRTWTGTDDCGNTSSCIQSIFFEDNVIPAITCVSDTTINCSVSTLPSTTGTPTVSDNCDDEPVLNYADVNTSGPCPQEHTITRTWTVIDGCGNSNSCIQIITLIDTIPPVITCAADVTIDCLDSSHPDSTGYSTSVDACDVAPEIAYSDVTVNGPTPNGYSIHRTWTAIDGCDNSSTCLQTIIVENPVDPELEGIEYDTICSGDNVLFTATNQGLGNTTYSWSFGSGSTPGSGAGIGPHNVEYLYNAINGTIGADVILTVTVDGCATVTDTVGNVHVNAIPNPAINASTANLCYYRVREFKPIAPSMPGFTYQWTFGPAANIPAIAGYGPHFVEFSTVGLKTVQLIVFSNEAGASCGDTAAITFNVIACPGNITGRVKKPDGTGIGNVNVRLYNDADLNGLPDGPSIRSVFTTATGTYSIVNLVPAQYVIGQTDLPNYFSLYDADETEDFDSLVNIDPNNNLIPATIEAQEIDGGNVFVDVLNPGIINGYVFEDFDEDFMPDAGEGIQNVTIQLHDDVNVDGIADAGPIATTTTSNIGWYTFGDLDTGSYVIVEIQLPGYENVIDFDFTYDADIVPNTDMEDDTIPVTISNAEVDAHNYFNDIFACSSLVTNTNDSGTGSLRDIISCSSAGDTIEFDLSLANDTIHLTSQRIILDKNLYIISTVIPPVVIKSTIPGAFKINAGVTSEFKNLDFISGLTGHLGAAFENYGHLILWDSFVSRNEGLAAGNYLIYNAPAAMVTAKGTVQIASD